MNRICVVCGSAFEAKTDRAKYCSEKCKNHSRFETSLEQIRMERESLKIELAKLNEKGLRDKEIAQKLGKSKTWVQKNRIEMGLPTQDSRKRQQIQAHKLELAQMEFRFCKRCGQSFYPRATNQIYCCKDCQKRTSHQIHDIERKRLVRQQKVDNIMLDAVFKKYNGICYLCGGKCDYQAVKYVDGVPKALGDYPSREHIKPISKGGLHSWDNVRLAHIKCNSSKGVRYG